MYNGNRPDVRYKINTILIKRYIFIVCVKSIKVQNFKALINIKKCLFVYP